MEDQVPFKVFMFWEDNGKPEVRRFGIAKCFVGSYVHIIEKLHDVYPEMENKRYNITWKDEEDDEVFISSDEELLTALNAMSGNLIKLFVYCTDKDEKNLKDAVVVDITVDATTVPESSLGAAADDKMPFHLGVTCDACDGAIYGNRYKCTVCPDYDLCSGCEAAGNHRNHFMVRLPSPTVPRAVIKAAIKRSRHIIKSVAAVMEECPYKKNRRDKSGESKTRGENAATGRQGEPPGGHSFRQRSSWMDTFASYMNEFANLAGDMTIQMDSEDMAAATQAQQKAKENKSEKVKTGVHKTGKPKTGKAKAEEPETGEPKTGEPKTGEPKTGEPKTGKTCPISNSMKTMQISHLVEVFTKNILAEQRRLAAAVNQKSVPKDVPETSDEVASTSFDVDMKVENKPSEAEELVKMDTSEGNSVNGGERDASPDKVDGWTLINNEKDLMDAYVKACAPTAPTAPAASTAPTAPAASTSQAAPIGFNLPEEFQERVRIGDGQNLYPSLNTATAVLNPKEPERPNVTQQSAAAQPEPAAAQPEPAAAQPKPAAAQPEPTVAQPKPAAAQPPPFHAFTSMGQALRQPKKHYHPKPHVDSAIRQMLAMGFTNEGGWLTQLLESKDGNIAAVLDLLTPVKAQK